MTSSHLLSSLPRLRRQTPSFFTMITILRPLVRHHRRRPANCSDISLGPSPRASIRAMTDLFPASKAAGARRIVNLIKAAGQTIHGVGLQCHLSITYKPTLASMISTLQGFTNLGVDVAYTEIDVKMTMPSDSGKLETQRQVYKDIAASCVAVPRCVGMSIWVSCRQSNWDLSALDL